MKKTHLAWAAILFMLAIYCLRVWAWNSARTGAVEQLIFRREAFFEFLGQMAWLLAAVIYVVVLVRIRKAPGLGHERAWLVILAAVALFAFGEESSWGQHILNFETPEKMEAINIQKEVNVHNLNIAEMLGLDPGTALYHYLEDASVLMSPVFFLGCYVLYFFLPMLKNWKRISRYAFIRRTVITDAVVIFLGFNLAAYFVMERLVPEADELYETALGIGVFLSAWDTQATAERLQERAG